MTAGRARSPLAALCAGLVALACAAVPARAMAQAPVETALIAAREAPARLVLAYWPSGGWRLRQEGRRAELALPGVRLAVSADAVALPAAGGAITALGSEIVDGTTYLRFGLACDCTLALHGDGRRLIIDVVGAERIAGPVAPGSGPAPRLAPPPVPRGGASGPDATTVTAANLEETRTRLLAELRRAAESGLVSLRGDRRGAGDDGLDRGAVSGAPAPRERPRPAHDGDPPGPGASVARAAVPVAPILELTPGPRALDDGAAPGAPPRIHTGPPMRTAAERRNDLVRRAPADACLGNDHFALPDPMTPPALAAEIARHRRALLGEFDRADPDSALALVRLYVANGMGAEALQLLAAFAPAAPESPVLAALAWLVEGRALPRPNLLSVPGCGGQHALWQAFDAALDGRHAEAVTLEAAADGGLGQVARGVRGRIAARLGLAAAAAKHWDAARRLSAMAERGLAPDDRLGGAMLTLLEARLDLADGDRAAAGARLAALRGAPSWVGAEALLMLADLATAEPDGTPVALDPLRRDLGVLATSRRGTPLGTRAFLAEARVTALAFGREAALELLSHGRAARLLGEDDYRDALVAIGSARPDPRGGTPLAVLFEHDPASLRPGLGDAGFRAALARSYIALGAPALAERVLHPGDLADGDLRRELAAAHLETGDLAAAERLARGLGSDADRAAIEAGIRRARGDMRGAFEALAMAEAPPDQLSRVAWAAGDWRASAAALATAAAGKTPVPPQGGRPGLERPEAALNSGQQAMAVRLALAARRAGAPTPPGEAMALAATDEGFGAGLQALFAPAPDLDDKPSPETLSHYLGAISDEARLFEEVLDDG